MWRSDAIWWHRYGSTLAQVMACCLMATSLTCTNVDISSIRSSDIQLRAVLLEIPQPSITKINFKITHLKFHLNLPRAKELMRHQHRTQHTIEAWGSLWYVLCAISYIGGGLISRQIPPKPPGVVFANLPQSGIRILTHGGLLMPYGLEILINIGSGNGFVLDCTKS